VEVNIPSSRLNLIDFVEIFYKISLVFHRREKVRQVWKGDRFGDLSLQYAETTKKPFVGNFPENHNYCGTITSCLVYFDWPNTATNSFFLFRWVTLLGQK